MSQASNGLGWVVQQYAQETGWADVTIPFAQKEAAEAAHVERFKDLEIPSRVYEALDHPTRKDS